jgi:hypothetical protein
MRMRVAFGCSTTRCLRDLLVLKIRSISKPSAQTAKAPAPMCKLHFQKREAGAIKTCRGANTNAAARLATKRPISRMFASLPQLGSPDLMRRERSYGEAAPDISVDTKLQKYPGICAIIPRIFLLGIAAQVRKREHPQSTACRAALEPAVSARPFSARQPEPGTPAPAD